MLQLPADRREALEVLDCLLAPGLASRAQRRPHDLLEQGRLAVSRAPEHPKVATRDAETRELGGRSHDFEIGLVIDDAPVPSLRLEDAELLQLAEQVLR